MRSIMIIMRVFTSESMIPRPCFQASKHRLLSTLSHVCSLPFYFRLQITLVIIHITCISLSLRRTSAPMHLTSVLGVLGIQETSCIFIAGLLERDIFDLYLPEFDKPWVIHLRETCCYSTNLCTWSPNPVYKNRSVHRHQDLFWRRCRGGKVSDIDTPTLKLISSIVVGQVSA